MVQTICEVIMHIDEYEKMWAEDCKIDETNLVAEAGRIPQLHSKYYKLYHRAAAKATKLRYDLKEMERLKTEYYNGTLSEEDLKTQGWKPNPLKILKSDISRYIESDKDIIELSLRIEYQSSIAKFLEDVVRQINNRNFIIRNMVDLLKFQQGGY
jgi:inorganic triphosphatase YgiF